MITFTVPVAPVPFKRALANGRRRYNDSRYTEFKSVVGLFARRAMHGLNPFTGAIKLSAKFFKPSPKNTSRNFGDVDNHLKSVMDALNGIAYRDDAQVTEVHAELLNGDPHVEIVLEELK